MAFEPGDKVTVVNGCYAWDREAYRRVFFSPEVIGSVLDVSYVTFLEFGAVAVVVIQFDKNGKKYKSMVAPGRVKAV